MHYPNNYSLFWPNHLKLVEAEMGSILLQQTNGFGFGPAILTYGHYTYSKTKARFAVTALTFILMKTAFIG